MLSEGESAPGFELPALVDGERRQVSLAEYLGNNVVILAFYPADFNPACDEDSCDLDELDLFTMQKDVAILGISPDSVYSHEAFADKYDLKVPLLADTDGEVAKQYGLDFVDDLGQHLIERGVVVLDHDGTVQYVWSTDEMTQLPRVEAIKDALAETGGDDTAFARYRVGHAHYVEGRRAFTSAMENFRESEWMLAQSDFDRAREEFTEAADHFDTATRFVDEEALEPIYTGANEKATALWQAADWLTRSASAYSSGSGAKGQELREDADRPMETVKEYVEPPDPDGEWPPEMDDLKQDPTSGESILPGEEEGEDAALTVDIDSEVDGDEELTEEVAESAPDEAEADADTAEADDTEVEKDIDDAEIADLQAEIAANNPDEEPTPDEIPGESTAMVEAPPGVDPDDEGEDTDEGVDELEDIQAEIAANNPDEEPSVDDLEESTAMVEAPPGVDPDDGPEPAAADGAETDTQATDGAGTQATDEAGADETQPAAEPAEADGSDDETPETDDTGATDAPDESADDDGADASAADNEPDDESAGDDEATGDAGDETTADDEAVESAKEELAELQAELGVELPDSGSDDDDG